MPGLLRMSSGRTFPPHIKVTAHQPPQRFFEETVVVNHYTNTDKLIPAIPGFKTSAAFLTSLSANLRIDPDLPSPLGTPNFRGSYSHGLPLPPPSPLSFSTLSHHAYPSAQPTTMSLQSSPAAPSAPVDALPALATYTASTEDDRVEGLRLVADSVAQQRQVTSKMLVFHPANLAAYFVALALLVQYLLRAGHDWIMIGTLIGGLTMSCFAAVRWAAGGYIGLAEEIDWEWLGEDRMIVVKWGEEIIGALVLGWADSEAAKKKGGRRKRGKAVVRAWTVKLKYRGKGVGEGLLEEAVKVAGEKGADGIVFDAEHANSTRLLPRFYNGFLDKREARAEKALEKVADEKGNFRQRRSSPTWGSR
ncbi:hypothetical protein K505DRAFT_323434 [Melanomma pulvis-pyrius CBS 109.77]|uniref:N-acetyltransferase domain-containing protein n=1 Tax=Melanomma pulvis-pyrius CBS 109.77 TaxID=1314802 RepID=A0A6A6XID7_9PLEO|nr:hypothetical protein K505DRAFT_323434 [Melanomma pulvis-pyrius CBS 109.77]